MISLSSLFFFLFFFVLVTFCSTRVSMTNSFAFWQHMYYMHKYIHNHLQINRCGSMISRLYKRATLSRWAVAVPSESVIIFWRLLSLPSQQYLPYTSLDCASWNGRAVSFVEQDSVDFPFPVSNYVSPNLSLRETITETYQDYKILQQTRTPKEKNKNR